MLNISPFGRQTENGNRLRIPFFVYFTRSVRRPLPSDYHFSVLKSIQTQIAEILFHQKMHVWTRADVLLSDAFFRICHDLSRGRIPYDTLNSAKDTQYISAKSISVSRNLLNARRWGRLIWQWSRPINHIRI